MSTIEALTTSSNRLETSSRLRISKCYFSSKVQIPMAEKHDKSRWNSPVPSGGRPRTPLVAGEGTERNLHKLTFACGRSARAAPQIPMELLHLWPRWAPTHTSCTHCTEQPTHPSKDENGFEVAVAIGHPATEPRTNGLSHTEAQRDHTKGC